MTRHPNPDPALASVLEFLDAMLDEDARDLTQHPDLAAGDTYLNYWYERPGVPEGIA